MRFATRSPARRLAPFSNEVQVVAVNPAVKAKSVPKIKFTYTVYGIGKRLPRFEGPPEIKDYKTPKHTNKFFKFMKGYRDEVRHLLASKKDDQAEAFLRRKWTIAPEINGKRYVVTPVACSCCLLPLHAPVACSCCMLVLPNSRLRCLRQRYSNRRRYSCSMLPLHAPVACSPCMLPLHAPVAFSP